MEVTFLKAGKGDAIWIRHEKKNILIDGGDDSSYLLNATFEILHRKESIDLLLVTHHDNDHIHGCIEILKHIKQGTYNGRRDFVKLVGFNSARLIREANLTAETLQLNYVHASEFDKMVRELDIAQMDPISNIAEPIEFEGLRLTFLSPTQQSLKQYSEKKGALLFNKASDWNVSLAKLEEFIDDTSLDKGGANESSIVVQLEWDNKRALLTGDVTPNRLAEIIEKMYGENDNKLVDFEFVKLPHHGSLRSLSERIISKLACANYVISTNGKANLPDKKAILKVLKFRDKERVPHVKFLFNYGEVIKLLNITEVESATRSFSLIPNNEKNGYCFRTTEV
jgi:beta-lactamase superfamily II metal-dependent hydrolase